MTVTLDQLLKDKPVPMVARPSERVDEVMERMRDQDYSQLPVVADDATELRAIGLISTTTIARTALYLDIPPSRLRVHHAVDGHPIKRKLGDDLWRTLDQARQSEVLLVEDDDGILRGILTGQDFTTYLRQQTEDDLTVKDIEITVKQLILEHYRNRDAELRELVERELGVQHRSLEKAVRGIISRCMSAASAKFDPTIFADAFQKQLPDKTSYEFDRLTFHQYQQIMLGEECWAAYADDFDLPLEHMRTLLDLARNLRNQIAHNRGLPTPAERARLIYCRQLLSRVVDRCVEAGPVPAPVEREQESTPTSTEPAGPAPTGWAQLEGFANGADRVNLTFSDIETFTKTALPTAAREHRSWWTNDEEEPQSAQWLDVGWRVVRVNMSTATVTFGHNTDREQACIAIFGAIFRELAKNPSWTFGNFSPAGRTWQFLVNIGKEDHSAWIEIGFAKGDRFRMSLYIDADTPEPSKRVFDTIIAKRDDVEAALRWQLNWERNPHRRASRVALYYPRSISIDDDEAAVDELATWVAVQLPKFAAAMQKALSG
jgi:predicted transcriptional regulator